MKHKNWIGLGVMLLMIVAALMVGSVRSVNRLRDDAEDAYYYDQTGFAIYQGLDARVAAAENLITVAERYETDRNVKDAIDELEYQVRLYENAWGSKDGFAQEARANAGMGHCAESLGNAVLAASPTARDEQYVAEQLAEMESQQDKIERSSYNDDARAFNARLTKFPMSLFKAVGLTRELAVFDGGTESFGG